MKTRHTVPAEHTITVTPTNGSAVVALDDSNEYIGGTITAATTYGPFRLIKDFLVTGRATVSVAEASAGGDTGWADYTDGNYTSGSPFQPTPDEWTAIDFDSVTVRDSQKPADIETFFDTATSKITGRNGDGLSITIEFKAKPTTATATYVDVAIDIGGAIGRIYPRTISFPKGQNVERTVSFNVDGYTLDTWETNGGSIVFNPTAAIDIYDARVVCTRTHRAR